MKQKKYKKEQIGIKVKVNKIKNDNNYFIFKQIMKLRYKINLIVYLLKNGIKICFTCLIIIY